MIHIAKITDLEELSREFYALDTRYIFDSRNANHIVDLIQRTLDIDCIDRIELRYFHSAALDTDVLSFRIDTDEYYLTRNQVSRCKYRKHSTEMIYKSWRNRWGKDLKTLKKL